MLNKVLSERITPQSFWENYEVIALKLKEVA